MTTTVAVIGLGAMGLPMASRLAERFTVRGFDIAAERIALAAEAGVAPASSAADAVSGADAVLVAVRTGAQLNELLFGADGSPRTSPMGPSSSSPARWAPRAST